MGAEINAITAVVVSKCVRIDVPRQTASRSQQRSVHPMDRIDREYRLSRFRPQRWEAKRALGMIPISRLSGSSPLHSNVLVRFARTLRRTFSRSISDFPN